MFWFNASWKTSIRFTPYEGLYRRPKTTKVQTIEDNLYERDRMIKLSKDYLYNARDKMKFILLIKKRPRDILRLEILFFLNFNHINSSH